jgi:VanZ family protein
VLVLSVMPTDSRLAVGSLDKVGHLCEYLVFAWLLVQAIRATRSREREYVLWAWLYATSYGGLMELLQAALPWRRADWTDALINALGAALGVAIGQAMPPRVQSP